MDMENTFINEEVLRLAEENDVKFVRLQFTDLFGMSKNIAIQEACEGATVIR